MAPNSLRGVFAAVLTPMHDDGAVDLRALGRHCTTLMREGCHGVSLFGTTGEGPALTAEERMAGLEAVLEAGVPAANILPGTGCAAIPDAVRLTRHAVAHGCTNVLLMPPFFFKDVSDEGVAAVYSRIIDRVADPALRIVIYNFPAVTGVWVREDAIARINRDYPEAIAGVKDSSGDWGYVNGLLDRFPDLGVFTGWETLVPRLVQAGGAGNISGLANVIPGVLRDLYERCPTSPEDRSLIAVTRVVEAVGKFPVIAAIKALAANLRHSAAWRNMRAPLVPLSAESERSLLASFEHAMQGLKMESRSNA